MPRVYYMANTGHAWVDYIHPRFRIVEFRDGYHPISNETVWRPGTRDSEPCVYVWQGRTSPEGSSKERVRFVMKETNRLKDNRQPILVSKLWVRWLKQGIIVTAWLVGIAVALYVAYVIATVR